MIVTDANESTFVRGDPPVPPGAFGALLMASTSLGAAKTILAYSANDLGLGNVNNTSDVNKPVSSAQQVQLDLKADKSELAANSESAPGSTLILHRKGGAGTFGRTLRQWAVLGGMDDDNVFNHIDSGLDSAILGRTNATDLTPYIQNAAAAAKGRLYFPSGTYEFNSVVAEDVLIQGAGIGEQDIPLGEGTIFLHKSTADPLFHMKRGSAFRGFSVYNPDQVTTGTPVAYAPTFLGDPTGTETNISFEDIVAINPYIFVRFGDEAKTTSHGRLSIRNSSIFGISRCVEAYSLLDTLQISGCFFTHGPWDTILNGTGTVKNWTAGNGQCIVADRVDGLQFQNNLLFGYQQGLRVINALSDLWNVTGNLFDATLYGMILEGAGDLSNCNIVGNNFYSYQFNNPAAEGAGILLNGSGTLGSELNITGNNFALSRGNHITVSNTSAKTLLIANNQFGPLGTATGATGPRYAVSVNDADANVIINGNTVEPSYASAAGLSIFNAKTVSVVNNTIVGANLPISVEAVSASAMIAGNTTTDTIGTISVNVPTALAGKTVFGPNAFDKDLPASIGAPKFSALLSAGTTSTGAETTVQFGAEIMDTSGGYNAATSVFTAPRAGVYRFSFELSHDSTILATDVWIIKLKTTQREFSSLYRAPAADNLSINKTVLAAMNAGETAQVTVTRLSGTGNFSTILDGNLTRFSGELVL